MKAIEQFFPDVLFIMLHKVVLTFESVSEILKCDYSNESYWAVLSCGAVYYDLQDDSNLWVWGWNLKVWPFKLSSISNWAAIEQYFTVVLFTMLYKVVQAFEIVDEILFVEPVFIVLHKVVLTFESVDEIPKCDIQMKATEQ